MRAGRNTIEFPYANVAMIGCLMLPSAISLSGVFPYVGFMVMDLVNCAGPSRLPTSP